MRARSFWLLSFVAVTACGSTPAAVTAPVPAGPDAHAIEPDEYLVANGPVPEGWTGLVDGWVGKMQKPADPGGEAVFYIVSGNGREMKAKTFFKSHVAAKTELKAGVLVACFRDAKSDEVMHAPPTPKASRDGHWALGHVSDVAEVSAGIARVGPLRCALDAVRVLVPPALGHGVVHR